MICVSAAADDETAKHRPDLARRRADHPAGAFISAFLVACEVHDTQCVQNWKDAWVSLGWCFFSKRVAKGLGTSSPGNLGKSRYHDFLVEFGSFFLREMVLVDQ